MYRTRDELFGVQMRDVCSFFLFLRRGGVHAGSSGGTGVALAARFVAGGFCTGQHPLLYRLSTLQWHMQQLARLDCFEAEPVLMVKLEECSIGTRSGELLRNCRALMCMSPRAEEPRIIVRILHVLLQTQAARAGCRPASTAWRGCGRLRVAIQMMTT